MEKYFEINRSNQIDMFLCTEGVDLLLSCFDIHGIISTHVETLEPLKEIGQKSP